LLGRTQAPAHPALRLHLHIHVHRNVREQERNTMLRDERFRGGVWFVDSRGDARPGVRWFDFAMLRIAALTMTKRRCTHRDEPGLLRRG
jgi:hypothetical protein